MSFLMTYVVVFVMMSTAALLTVRRLFLASEMGGYVLVAFNWGLLMIATAIFALLIQAVERMLSG